MAHVRLIKDDQIKLHLQAPERESRHYQSASFFPARQTLIDHKTPVALIPKADDLSHYTLVLKDADSQSRKAAFLSGVVVLSSEGDHSSGKALEVHVPILEKNPSDQSSLAMLNAQEKEALQLAHEV